MIDMGKRRELFVDDYLIDELRGARLQLARPERREAAMTFDAPWEDDAAFPFAIIQEGGVVRLHYRAAVLDRKDEDNTVVTALAESADGGVSFARPELGLIEFQGSRKNNLTASGRGKEQKAVTPLRDANPACPPEQRYKGFAAEWKKLFVLGSPDGLRWRMLREGPVDMPGEFDTVNTGFWDAVAGCYRCFTRSWKWKVRPCEKAPNVRCIQMSTSPDFIHWTPPVQAEYVDGDEFTQLYTNAVVPCPGAEHVFLGFPNRFVEERQKAPAHAYPGVNDALFMASRDGVHWTRYLDAWVRPGPDPLNWTERNNYPVWGIVQTSPTEWSMYVTEHYRHPGTPSRMRRLSIRPWGFVSMHGDYAGGEMTTKPFVFAGAALHLNYATSAAGEVRVEVQDEQGCPAPGLSFEDMDGLFGDDLDAVVNWRGGGDLSRLAGRPVRLRFRLKDADVFSLRFA